MVKQENIGKALVAICKAGDAIYESGMPREEAEELTDDICVLGNKLKKYLSQTNQDKFYQWLIKKEKQAKERA